MTNNNYCSKCGREYKKHSAYDLSSFPSRFKYEKKGGSPYDLGYVAHIMSCSECGRLKR